MPYKKKYTRSRKRKSTMRYRKKRTTKRRTSYRRKSKPDSGTFLKISSTAIPVILNNNSGGGTPDTLQCQVNFRAGKNNNLGDATALPIQIKQGDPVVADV